MDKRILRSQIFPMDLRHNEEDNNQSDKENIDFQNIAGPSGISFYRNKEETENNASVDYNKEVGLIIARLENLEECKPGPRLQLFSKPSRKPDIRKSLIQTYLNGKTVRKVTSTPRPPKKYKELEIVVSPSESPIQSSNHINNAEEIENIDNAEDSPNYSNIGKKSNDIIVISDGEDQLDCDVCTSQKLTYKPEHSLDRNSTDSNNKDTSKRLTHLSKQNNVYKDFNRNRSKDTDYLKVGKLTPNKKTAEAMNSNNHKIEILHKLDSCGQLPKVILDRLPSTFNKSTVKENNTVNYDHQDDTCANACPGSKCNKESEMVSSTRCDVNVPLSSVGEGSKSVLVQVNFLTNDATLLRKIDKNNKNLNNTKSSFISTKENMEPTSTTISKDGEKAYTNSNNNDAVSEDNIAKNTLKKIYASEKSKKSLEKTLTQRHIGTSPPSFRKKYEFDLNRVPLTTALCKSIQTSNHNTLDRENNIESGEGNAQIDRVTEDNKYEKSTAHLNKSKQTTNPLKLTHKIVVNNSIDLLQVKNQAHNSIAVVRSKKNRADEEELSVCSSTDSHIHNYGFENYGLFESLQNGTLPLWETRNDLIETNKGSGKWRLTASIVPLSPTNSDNTLVASVNDDSRQTFTPKHAAAKNKISLSIRKRKILTKRKCLSRNEILEKTPRSSTSYRTEQNSLAVSRKKAKLNKSTKKSSIALISPSNSFLISKGIVEYENFLDNDTDNVTNKETREISECHNLPTQQNLNDLGLNATETEEFSPNLENEVRKDFSGDENVAIKNVDGQLSSKFDSKDQEAQHTNAKTGLKKANKLSLNKLESQTQEEKDFNNAVYIDLKKKLTACNNLVDERLLDECDESQIIIYDKKNNRLTKQKLFEEREKVDINKKNDAFGMAVNNREVLNNKNLSSNIDLIKEQIGSPQVNKKRDTKLELKKLQKGEKNTEKLSLDIQETYIERTGRPQRNRRTPVLKTDAYYAELIKENPKKSFKERHLLPRKQFDTYTNKPEAGRRKKISYLEKPKHSLKKDDQSRTLLTSMKNAIIEQPKLERPSSEKSPTACIDKPSSERTYEYVESQARNEMEEGSSFKNKPNIENNSVPKTKISKVETRKKSNISKNKAHMSNSNSLKRSIQPAKEINSSSVLPLDNVAVSNNFESKRSDGFCGEDKVHTNNCSQTSVALQIGNYSDCSTVPVQNYVLPTVLNFNDISEGIQNEIGVSATNTAEFTEIYADQNIDKKDSVMSQISMMDSKISKCISRKKGKVTRAMKYKESTKANFVGFVVCSRIKELQHLKPHFSAQLNETGVLFSDITDHPNGSYTVNYLKIQPQKKYSSTSTLWVEYSVLDGKGLVEVAGEKTELKSHEIFYISPGNEYCITNNGSEDLLLMCHTVRQSNLNLN